MRDYTLTPAYKAGHTDGYNCEPPRSTGETYISGYRDGRALGIKFGIIVVSPSVLNDVIRAHVEREVS